jgi:hypothetical protein
MKYYESHYEEYIESKKKYELHPELSEFMENLPEKAINMGNLIVYGPSGVGKYSQVLQILKKYSSTQLKYDKKLTAQTEKQNYTYHISDIHYEIDMSLLGCNFKILWNEIFLQIVDIISIKTEKIGFIVCKNFHTIHGELLDVFYSYIQQYSKGVGNHFGCNITIFFILITENISFLPNNIINACQIVNLCRPSKNQYKEMIQNNISTKDIIPSIYSIFDTIECNEIINIKELYSFHNIKDNNIPKDVFNIVCDNIIYQILNHNKINFTGFRDIIYDILIYNLEAVEILWSILFYLIHHESENISNEIVQNIIKRSYTFLKYYNNNYRPIYHLESILFYIIVQFYKYNENNEL